MNENKYTFVDPTNIIDICRGLGESIKSKLGEYALKSQVVDFEYLNNYVLKSVYNHKIQSIETTLNNKPNIDDSALSSSTNTYSIDKIKELLAEKASSFDFIRLEELNKRIGWTDATISVKSYIESLGYQTNIDVLSIVNDCLGDYYTKNQVDDLLPNLTNYYTKNETNAQITAACKNLARVEQLAATNSSITSLQQLVKQLSSTISSTSSGLYDLNNIYFWSKLPTKTLVVHSGDNSEITEDETGYKRNFIPANYYRKKDIIFPSVKDNTYTLSLTAKINYDGTEYELSNISKDYDKTTILSSYSENVIKNYLDNIINIQNSGITSPFGDSVADVNTWNNFINDFKKDINQAGLDKLIISKDHLITGTIIFSVLPFIKESRIENLNETDDPETERYKWVFNYKDNGWDGTPTNSLSIHIYQPDDKWSDDDDINASIASIMNTYNYYTQSLDQIKYLDDQRFAKANCEQVSEDNNKYEIYYGNKKELFPGILKFKFVDLLRGFLKDNGLEKIILYYKKDNVGKILDSTNNSDKLIIKSFINNYLINNDIEQIQVDDEGELIGDDLTLKNTASYDTNRITSVKVRYGKDYLYTYNKKFIEAKDVFENINKQGSITSFRKGDSIWVGDVHFNEEVEDDEVLFDIETNNNKQTLRGFVNSTQGMPIGCIVLFAGDISNNLPLRFLVCDGSEYLIEDYPSLYGVIGDNYNDDDTQPGYFKVPDMRNIIQKMNYIIKY